MDITGIIEIKKRLQILVDSHPSELGDCTCETLSVSSSELMKQYNEKMNPHRLLHIGLVGRVKAGKSSLLNSLFFGGKDILPKAATPMTAALTMLNYSEKPYVKINFFTQDDYDRLKTKSDDYNRKVEEKAKQIYDEIRNCVEVDGFENLLSVLTVLYLDGNEAYIVDYAVKKRRKADWSTTILRIGSCKDSLGKV